MASGPGINIMASEALQKWTSGGLLPVVIRTLGSYTLRKETYLYAQMSR